MMNTKPCDDPFSAEADPDWHLHAEPEPAVAAPREPALCHCEAPARVSRRQLIAAAGMLSVTPLVAQTGFASAPCYQPEQKVRPCRHKFCRNFGGGADYYLRRINPSSSN